MALGEALGRILDIVPVAAGAALNLSGSYAAGITFVATGNDTFVVKCGATHGGSFTAFSPITRYYTKTGTTGATVWVDSGDLPLDLGTVTIGSGAISFYVGLDDLPAGSGYVEVVPGTSGLVIALLHDFQVDRNPKYLVAPNL